MAPTRVGWMLLTIVEAGGRMRPATSVVQVSGALLVGAVHAVVAVSLGTLIFGGDLASDVASGLAVSLAGSAVLAVVVAARSGVQGNFAVIQDSSAVVLAVMATDVAATLRADGRPGAVLPTLLALLVLTSVVTGVTLVVLGRARLGRAVRYLPSPVIGGFLAGTGLLLILGGMQTMTGLDVRPGNVVALLDPDMLLRWVPGLAAGVALLVALRRGAHGAVLPLGLLGLGIAVHVVRVATGSSVDDATRSGVLPAGLPNGALWDRLGPGTTTGADLLAVASQLPGMLVIVLVTAASVLLNATALEASLGVDVDADRELVTAGTANVLSGLVGGPPGWSALSIVLLARRLRVTALAPWAAAVTCLLVLAGGGGLLRLVPLAVIGAVLVLLGADFVASWAIRSGDQPAERALVLLIAGVTAWRGFLAGAAVGLVGALALFVAAYSRTGIVRLAATGRVLRSRVDRPAQDAAVLEERGDAVFVLVLHGYVFFGSAYGLLVRVRSWLAATPAPRAVVLDLSAVTGLDGSALAALQRVDESCMAAGALLIVCGSTDGEAFTRRGQDFASAPDLDRGLELAEALLLGSADRRDARVCAAPELARVARELDVVGGDVLLTQGSDADALLFVLEGQVSAWDSADPHGGGRRVRTMGPGSFVGEVSFFQRGGATATVIADGPGRLLVLDRTGWDALSVREANAVQRAVLDVMALRLRTLQREAEAYSGVRAAR